ncbi:MAG: hypothetical protein FWG46_01495 [Treponema sp.]|nr:hypothetical protein [Treponema sp.]
MIRIEIIANHSVEENILEALAKENAGKYYTKYPGILGVGSAGPRMGDAIWPEENFALVIWCERDEAVAVKRAVAKVKEKFPGEGIKMFILSSASSSAPAASPGGEHKPPPVHLGPVGENI